MDQDKFPWHPGLTPTSQRSSETREQIRRPFPEHGAIHYYNKLAAVHPLPDSLTLLWPDSRSNSVLINSFSGRGFTHSSPVNSIARTLRSIETPIRSVRRLIRGSKTVIASTNC